MITSESIELVLNEYWPDECEEIGPGNVRRIVRASGKISIEQADGGAYLDLSESLQLVAAIATILQFGLEIYVIIKEQKNTEPTTSEILRELSTNVEQMSKLPCVSIISETVSSRKIVSKTGQRSQRNVSNESYQPESNGSI